ncbi:MAG: Peptidyl-prolyl cis-trans isomerase [uncultured Acidimicrobiales bacterium]|uniref:Peptidyl-prolyl cis-trans isomerase n=1 Tax=uncultured Acidimicrobiales bacterium TaxID=310071 RepID=A0A6J4H0P5_9ACTN|nr:MAG: Peptidyl-prolyl cis-trans isomerase [uncultured Acidimicrobiales bacterium]
MPSDKRQRHREGRDSRRVEALAAQRKAAKRRQIISVAVLVAVILGIGFLLSRTGGDDDTVSASGDPGTTTTTTAPSPAVAPTCPPAEGVPTPNRAFTGAPVTCIDPAKRYSATVTTDVGSFTIDLDATKAPVTVNSFVFLARHGYYREVPFHRVIPGFVVQGGANPAGAGNGGPGYRFNDELPAAGDYKIGSVVMANSGPNTNGSQFFVITGDQGVALDPKYNLFGQVTGGLDVVKKIEADGSPTGTPATSHRITDVKINESAK